MKKKDYIIFSAVVIIVAVFFIIPIVSNLSEPRQPRAECLMRLNQIGLLRALYSVDHKDGSPTNMAALMPYWPKYSRPEYRHTLSLFVCPASGHTPGAPDKVDVWTDFQLFTNSFGADLDVPFAFCSPEHHDGIGGHILFRDGSIEWYASENFTNVMNRGKK